MNDLSNERLKEIVSHEIGSDAYPRRTEWQAMARELLAYREAAGKPVAHIFQHPQGKLFWAISDDGNAGSPGVIPVYAAPQLPAMPDDLLHMAASAIEDLLDHIDPATSYYAGVWADVPGKLRAATPSVGNSPVIPDGWALVPIDATPEMLNASWVHHGIHHPSAWRTMIAAAPKPPAAENQ